MTSAGRGPSKKKGVCGIKTLRTAPKHAKIPCVDRISSFLKDAYEELKRIQWPTKKETTRLTGLLIGVSLGVGTFVMSFDYLFTKLLGFILQFK
jgi:preprotein translocase subunit SecE